MAVMEEPSVAREIAKVAWMVTKLVVCATVIFAGLVLAFQQRPWIAEIIFCGLVVAWMVINAGRMSYKDKKSALEQQERDREWEEARKRRERSA